MLAVLGRSWDLSWRSWAALWASVGGLGPSVAGLGPMLAVLGGLRPKSGPNPSGSAIHVAKASEAPKAPYPFFSIDIVFCLILECSMIFLENPMIFNENHRIS